MTSNRAYIFLHIPKTAGTTLRSIIEDNYRDKKIYKIEHDILKSINEFESMSPESRNSFDLIYGHLPFGFHEHLSRPCRYFTFLRDPVERIVSNYYYVKENDWHYMYETIHENRMSIEDYVSSGVCTELENGQTRLLAGCLSGATNFAKDVEFGRTSQDMLKKAKQNLKRYFDVVGITEKFDESLLLLSKKLGWKNISYNKINVTKSKPDEYIISKGARNIVEKYNMLDMELYDYCLQLFEGRHKQSNRYEKYILTIFNRII